jgi:phosphoribosylformimino-5-aminoimidazole carboxamide ribotide isomerase
MQIWPAIDLRGGRCVRLQQGDYQRETVFGDDPLAMARHWVGQGARRLHLVDLDGARGGTPGNRSSVLAVVQHAGVPCQLGGGIRDERAIADWLAQGIQRLVVGTRAARDPAWFREVCRRFPHRLVLGIDAREGRVAVEGWEMTVDLDALEFARQWSDEPLAAIVYTDIAADGMLAGPNVPAMQAMVQAVALPVIASGGVSTLDDVRRLRDAGVAGCIVGRALYEGRLRLSEALQAAGDQGDA